MQLGHVTLEAHIPSATGILRKTARLDSADNGAGEPQAEADTTIRDRLPAHLDIPSLEGNPAQRTLATAPLQFDLLELATACHIFGTDLLNGIGREPQVFRGPSRHILQVVGRQKRSITTKGDDADLIAIVPDVVDRRSHLEEMLAR